MTKFKTGLAIFLILAVGFLSGVMGSRLYIKNRIQNMITHAGHPPMGVFFHLSRKLGLSSEQKEQVKKIISDMGPKWQKLWEAHQPDVENLFQENMEQIKKVLNDEQIKKLDEEIARFKEREKRMEKGGPKGAPGEFPGRMGERPDKRTAEEDAEFFQEQIDEELNLSKEESEKLITILKGQNVYPNQLVKEYRKEREALEQKLRKKIMQKINEVDKALAAEPGPVFDKDKRDRVKEFLSLPLDHGPGSGIERGGPGPREQEFMPIMPDTPGPPPFGPID